MAEVLEKITGLLEPLLEGTDIFLVTIRIRPTNNIEVYLDADGGLSIEKSARINRHLYAAIEDSELFPDGDFSLEVGSPGVDEPLTSQRQYKKNIGRTVAVTLGEEGKERIGLLKQVTEEGIVIAEQQGKKKETIAVAIPHTDIKKIVVQVVF